MRSFAYMALTMLANEKKHIVSFHETKSLEEIRASINKDFKLDTLIIKFYGDIQQIKQHLNYTEKVHGVEFQHSLKRLSDAIDSFNNNFINLIVYCMDGKFLTDEINFKLVKEIISNDLNNDVFAEIQNSKFIELHRPPWNNNCLSFKFGSYFMCAYDLHDCIMKYIDTRLII